jgi:hypothetical protein
MANIAAEFIRAYYTSLVYSPDDLPQFYDQEAAAIWRDQLGDAPASPFDQTREVLVPDIPRGAKVAVLRFTALPIPSGFSIVVVGEIGHGGASRPFHQCFTLAAFQDRFFVVGDYLTFYGNIDREFVPPDSLFEVEGQKAPPYEDEALFPAAKPEPQPKAPSADPKPQNPPPGPERPKSHPPGKWIWTPGQS